MVFKTPVDNRTDYIKRLVGLPGETIQFINGDLFINNQVLNPNDLDVDIRCGPFKFNTDIYKETMPNGKVTMLLIIQKTRWKILINMLFQIIIIFLLGIIETVPKTVDFYRALGM